LKLNKAKIGVITPIRTSMGPNVMPRKPKPKGSLSKVMTKKPITIMAIPMIKIEIRLESNGIGVILK
jgi:hypothetical protein